MAQESETIGTNSGKQEASGASITGLGYVGLVVPA
jgi:hypothetical protein